MSCGLPLPTPAAAATIRRPNSWGSFLEVSREHQERSPRRRVLSRSPVSDAKASRPRRASSVGLGWFMATKSFSRSSVAMTHAHAAQGAGFKRCCMHSGQYDGVLRDYFFQRVGPSSNPSFERANQQCARRTERAAVERARPVRPAAVSAAAQLNRQPAQ